MYNVTLKLVHETIFAVEKQKVLYISVRACVHACVVAHVGLHAHLCMYAVVGVLSHKQHDF